MPKNKITAYISPILIGLFILMSLNIVIGGLSKISFIYTALFYFTLFKILSFALKKIKPAINKNIVLLLASIIISLFAVEFALRFILKKNLTYQEQNGSISYASFYVHSNWFNQKKRKRKQGALSEYLVGKPNSSRLEKKKEYSYSHNYNSLGLRDNDIPQTKPKGEYRIIGLGDSFTEGLGAPQDSSWVVLLERVLEKRTGKTSFNCINAGAAGSDPVFEYHFMANKLVDLQPDLVLLAINGTDSRDIFLRGGHNRYNNEGILTLKKGPWWEYFYGTSFIIRFIVRDLLKFNDYLVKDKGFELKLQQSFDVIYEVIIKFQELAKRNNFDFKVVFIPFYPEMYQQRMQLDPMYQFLVEQNKANQAIYLPPCYSKYMSYFNKEPLDYYWEIDSHHNSKGYEMLAECIAESLLN